MVVPATNSLSTHRKCRSFQINIRSDTPCEASLSAARRAPPHLARRMESRSPDAISCQSHSSNADRHNTSSRVLNSQRTSELAKLPVIVMEQELRLFLKAGVPYLLFRPLEVG